jgi:hypothetical protein
MDFITYVGETAFVVFGNLVAGIINVLILSTYFNDKNIR